MDLFQISVSFVSHAERLDHHASALWVVEQQGQYGGEPQASAQIILSLDMFNLSTVKSSSTPVFGLPFQL